MAPLELEKGDVIGIYSPSFPATYRYPKRFQRACNFLQEKGFVLKYGKLTGKEGYYRSGTIEERAKELNDLLEDDHIKCIIASIGGMNSNSLLDKINYSAFINNPKIIVGHSDATAVLMALYAQTGISTFYGPNLVTSFGELEPFNNMTYKYFADILCKQTQWQEYVFKKPSIWTEEFIDWETQNKEKKGVLNTWIPVRTGIARGRLIIGNLDTMTTIWGTKYMPQIKEGDILFVEDSLKDIDTVERSFAMLKLHGIFEKLGGIILGKYEKFNDKGTGMKPYMVLLEMLGDVSIPILADVDCGHTHPTFTMPIGCEVVLTVKENIQEIKLVDGLKI